MSNGDIQFGNGPSFAYPATTENFVQQQERQQADLAVADALIRDAKTSVSEQLQQALQGGSPGTGPQTEQELIRQLAQNIIGGDGAQQDATASDPYDSLLAEAGSGGLGQHDLDDGFAQRNPFESMRDFETVAGGQSNYVDQGLLGNIAAPGAGNGNPLANLLGPTFSNDSDPDDSDSSNNQESSSVGQDPLLQTINNVFRGGEGIGYRDALAGLPNPASEPGASGLGSGPRPLAGFGGPAGNYNAIYDALTQDALRQGGLGDDGQRSPLEEQLLNVGAENRQAGFPQSTRAGDVSADRAALNGKNTGFTFNSDATLTGSANGQNLAANGNLKQSNPNLIDVSSHDMPGGFQLSSTSGDPTGAGNQYTQSFDGRVNGHHVNVASNGDGQIVATVDGQQVQQGQSIGPVSYQAGGPGGCGIVTIAGRGVNADGSSNGASINVQITEDITNTNGVSGPAATWAHHGLTATVDNINGPGGGALNIGGAVGNELNNQLQRVAQGNTGS